MRPARKGPETLFRAGLWIPGAWGFNEAGPQGAGNVARRMPASVAQHGASMRPARKGPETSRSISHTAPSPSLNTERNDTSARQRMRIVTDSRAISPDTS